MPGMQSGIGVSNALIAEAFRSALRQQLIIVAVIFLALWLARLIALRSWPIKSTAGTGSSAGKARTGGSAGKAGTGGSAGKARSGGSAGKARTGEDARTATQPEPPGRRLLRIGFGILWIFDGILQAQPAMPIGMPAQVIKPTAQSSPAWVQHVVNAAGTVWTYHPIQISAAAVWIQVGIGIWLIAGSRGPLSRLAGLAEGSSLPEAPARPGLQDRHADQEQPDRGQHQTAQ